MSLSFGDFELDPERRQLLRSGQPVPLEPKAFELLSLLVERRPRVLSRAQIRDVVWPDVFITESTLNQAVNTLRQALDDDAREPRFIRTARGFGYAFCGEARDTSEGRPRRGRAAREPEASPYPGLGAFTEADAEVFCGREVEVATLWEKIQRHRLLAVMGPSGVGKTSFLRAGVIPTRPPGWAAACATPGSSPALALARSLITDLAGDAEAVEELLRAVQELSRSGESSGLRAAITRWREGSEGALLVVDQFEELFTLNPRDVQRQFAHLLAQVAEADVRVLLSLRDDFLFRCSEHESLRSVFLDLTPLRPPLPEALRRALVEPAQRRGFDFEEHQLVEEMVETVGDERGALPLLAFAVSRLWDERDRERKLLTRAAYEAVGGVAGALARHAEATLQRIGADREHLVREIFRNLVTAEGTRSAVDREEVLSVFPTGHADAGSERDRRGEAGGVLAALVDARLLTEYQAASPEGAAEASGGEASVRKDGSAGRHRIEVIHESLLQAWPRLVLWRAQEQEGAILRDQLKQAARLWEEKGRPDELLWTGHAYEECRLWRTRYPGGLTSTEEAFADAMAAKASRQRRRQRLAVAAVVAGALSVATVMSFLWHRSETAEEQARAEARRAEAGRLLLLGRAQVEEDPSAALAYTTASLERADTPEARRFAVEVLWKGPMRIQVGSEISWEADFSPDGEWLAYGSGGSLRLWSSDGASSRTFPAEVSARFAVGPRSGLLLISLQPSGMGGTDLHVRSVSDWSLLRTLSFETKTGFLKLPASSKLMTASVVEHDGGRMRWLLRTWPLEGGEPTVVGEIDSRSSRLGSARPDPAGRRIARVDQEGRIFIVPTDRVATSPGSLVGRHEDAVRLAFSPDGTRLASFGSGGEIRLHELGSGAPPRVLHGPRGGRPIMGILEFSPDGTKLVSGIDRFVWLWDLTPPMEAEPTVLRPGEPVQTSAAVFEPSGRWLATMGSRASIWPLSQLSARVLRAHDKLAPALAFDPKGRWLVSGALDSTVRLWSLRGDSDSPSRLLFDAGAESGGVVGIDVDPEGHHLLVGCQFGEVFVVPVEGGRPRRLVGFKRGVYGVAFGPQGRLAAAVGMREDNPSEGIIRVWDLESDSVRTLEPGADADLLGRSLQFTHDGRLVSAGQHGVLLWDVGQGTYQVLHATADRFAMSPWGSRVCAGRADELTAWLCLDLQSSRSEAVDLSTQAPGGLPIWVLAMAPDEATLVSGDGLGVVRVGPRTGEPPHLLFGHQGSVRKVAVSPDGRWVASAGQDGTVRLWPMPDLSKPPLHTLPHEELLARLHALTNLRVVGDESSPGGYRVEADPFPGWATSPSW